MSSAPIAVLDTDVIVLLVGDEKSKARTEIVRGRILAMKEKGYSFWVPVPVLAELSTAGASLAALTKALSLKLDGLRTVELGVAAVESLGQMVAARIAAAKSGGKPYEGTRAAMKFDAMIAAIAHTLQAKYLLTANTRDFTIFFKAVKSKTEIHRADVPNPAFAYQLLLPESTTSGKADVIQMPGSTQTKG